MSEQPVLHQTVSLSLESKEETSNLLKQIYQYQYFNLINDKYGQIFLNNDQDITVQLNTSRMPRAVVEHYGTIQECTISRGPMLKTFEKINFNKNAEDEVVYVNRAFKVPHEYNSNTWVLAEKKDDDWNVYDRNTMVTLFEGSEFKIMQCTGYNTCKTETCKQQNIYKWNPQKRTGRTYNSKCQTCKQEKQYTKCQYTKIIVFIGWGPLNRYNIVIRLFQHNFHCVNHGSVGCSKALPSVTAWLYRTLHFMDKHTARTIDCKRTISIRNKEYVLGEVDEYFVGKRKTESFLQTWKKWHLSKASIKCEDWNCLRENEGKGPSNLRKMIKYVEFYETDTDDNKYCLLIVKFMSNQSKLFLNKHKYCLE